MGIKIIALRANFYSLDFFNAESQRTVNKPIQTYILNIH